jgi:hypothetical protein
MPLSASTFYVHCVVQSAFLYQSECKTCQSNAAEIKIILAHTLRQHFAGRRRRWRRVINKHKPPSEDA